MTAVTPSRLLWLLYPSCASLSPSWPWSWPTSSSLLLLSRPSSPVWPGNAGGAAVVSEWIFRPFSPAWPCLSRRAFPYWCLSCSFAWTSSRKPRLCAALFCPSSHPLASKKETSEHGWRIFSVLGSSHPGTFAKRCHTTAQIHKRELELRRFWFTDANRRLVPISELYIVSRKNTNGKQHIPSSVTSCQTRQRMRIDCDGEIVTCGWRPWIKNVFVSSLM